MISSVLRELYFPIEIKQTPCIHFYYFTGQDVSSEHFIAKHFLAKNGNINKLGYATLVPSARRFLHFIFCYCVRKFWCRVIGWKFDNLLREKNLLIRILYFSSSWWIENVETVAKFDIEFWRWNVFITCFSFFNESSTIWNTNTAITGEQRQIG